MLPLDLCTRHWKFTDILSFQVKKIDDIFFIITQTHALVVPLTLNKIEMLLIFYFKFLSYI